MKQNVTKEDLVKLVSTTANVDKKTTEEVLEKFFHLVPVILRKGENIELRGFGQYKVVERKKKHARNISQNTSVIIPAHKEMVFKFSKNIRKIS